MLLVEVKEFNSNETKFYIIDKEDLVNINIDEDDEYYVDIENGFTKGFLYGCDWIVNDEDVEVFRVIENYKIIDTRNIFKIED